MKVIKATGLVPVKALVRMNQLRAGTVFGLDPKLVGAALIAREVELFPIPDDVETIELAIPLPRSNDEAADTEADDGEDDAIVAIPDDWENIHWMKQVVLAQKITGYDLPVIADKKPLEVARDIIHQEIERRAAEGFDPNQQQ